MLVCAQLWHGPVARTLAALQLPLLAQLGICPDAGRLPRRRMSWLANILVGTRKLTKINQINQINQTNQTNYAFLKSTILLCFCKRQLDNQPTNPVVQPTQRCNQPTQLANQPTQLANQPTQLANQPNQRCNQPTQLANQPTQRCNQPNSWPISAVNCATTQHATTNHFVQICGARHHHEPRGRHGSRHAPVCAQSGH